MKFFCVVLLALTAVVVSGNPVDLYRHKRMPGFHAENNPLDAATRCGLANGIIGMFTGGGLGLPGAGTHGVDDCGLISGLVGTGTGLVGAAAGKRKRSDEENEERRKRLLGLEGLPLVGGLLGKDVNKRGLEGLPLLGPLLGGLLGGKDVKRSAGKRRRSDEESEERRKRLLGLEGLPLVGGLLGKDVNKRGLEGLPLLGPLLGGLLGGKDVKRSAGMTSYEQEQDMQDEELEERRKRLLGLEGLPIVGGLLSGLLGG